MQPSVAIWPYKSKTDLSRYIRLCAEIRPSYNQSSCVCCLAGDYSTYKQCFHSNEVIRNVLSISHLRKDCLKIGGIDSRIAPLESVRTAGGVIFGPGLRLYAQTKKYLHLS